MTPFEQGIEAFHEGMPLDANPYEDGTDESDSWTRGWYAAADGDMT